MAVRRKDFDESDEDKFNTSQSDIILHISPELQRRITIAAHQNHLSVDEYVERILDQAASQEVETALYQDKPLTSEMFRRVLEVSEEIMQHTNGYLFEDSTETIR